MDEKQKNSPLFSKEVTKALAITLALIFLFSVGSFLGVVISDKDDIAQSLQVLNPQNTGSTPLPSETQTTVPAQQVTPTAPPADSGTTAPFSDASTPAPSGAMSTAEIIALFNESANKVKTDASKVVKNYEDRTHNEELLIVPKVVSGLASSLLETSFKDDTDPIEYLTREEIKSEYQVPGVEWASTLTETEVMEATCTDNGTEYEVMIKLHPSENPEPGQGVAKAFDTITSSEVMEKAPSFVTGFTTKYENCIVKCKIDKQTKNTTWSNYTSTVVLGVDLTFMGSDLEAQVGMTFEKDYTITY